MRSYSETVKTIASKRDKDSYMVVGMGEGPYHHCYAVLNKKKESVDFYFIFEDIDPRHDHKISMGATVFLHFMTNFPHYNHPDRNVDEGPGTYYADVYKAYDDSILEFMSEVKSIVDKY